MFKADGTPLRAEVTVNFVQTVTKPKGQNPTSRSETRKIWVVHEGETLDWIAYREYGDPAQWRHIAETNGLGNPKDLYPGQVLKLTPLP
jgi:nucleoid-associated protein YgaU